MKWKLKMVVNEKNAVALFVDGRKVEDLLSTSKE